MKSKRSYLFLVFSFLLVFLFLLSACGSGNTAENTTGNTGGNSSAGEDDMAEVGGTFKLGVLGPFSGPSARTGDEFRQSATMAFEAVDYKVGPYTIEPVWIDSQSDPAKAAQAYEQAIVQDGIQAGVLNWHSSVAVSVMEVTAKHKIPHVFGFGATEVMRPIRNTMAIGPSKAGRLHRS
ncbi:MAG: ABC transporter substrate-binding protein [Anaerolineales bacterium]